MDQLLFQKGNQDFKLKSRTPNILQRPIQDLNDIFNYPPKDLRTSNSILKAYI